MTRAERIEEAARALYDVLDKELPFDHADFPEGFSCASFDGGDCDCGAHERNIEAVKTLGLARAALAQPATGGDPYDQGYRDGESSAWADAEMKHERGEWKCAECDKPATGGDESFNAAITEEVARGEAHQAVPGRDQRDSGVSSERRTASSSDGRRGVGRGGRAEGRGLPAGADQDPARGPDAGGVAGDEYRRGVEDAAREVADPNWSMAFASRADWMSLVHAIRVLASPPPAPTPVEDDCPDCNDGILTRAFAEPHDIPCPTCKGTMRAPTPDAGKGQP